MTIINTENTSVSTKLLTLQCNDDEIIVARLLSQSLNLPFVFLVWEEDKFHACTPTQVKVRDRVIHFVAKHGPKNLPVTIKSGDDKYISICVQSLETRLAVMWPISGAEIYLADEMLPLDLRFVTRAGYNQLSSDPSMIVMEAPLIHHVGENCLTCVVESEPVEFSTFIHKGRKYANLISDNKLDLTFRSFNSKRAALTSWYEKFPRKQKAIDASNLHPEQMKEVLYNNVSITKPSKFANKIFIEQAIKVQNLLLDNHVNCSVIGSLAMLLNGYECPVEDIDLAVNSIKKAREILENEFTIEVSSSSKWSSCAIRLHSTPRVDVTELTRFHWSKCTTLDEYNEIRFLNEEGLLWMKLLGEYERATMQPNYRRIQQKNLQNIGTLIPNAPFNYSFFAEFNKKYSFDNFCKLKAKLDGTTWCPIHVKSDFPTIVNAFLKGNDLLVPVINLGDPCQTTVTLGKPMQTATWHPLGEVTQDCKISGGKIWIDQIEMMGILECQGEKNADLRL